MATARGKIAQLHAINANGEVRALECDDNDALYVSQTATGVYVVKQTDPSQLCVGLHGYDGTDWQKLGLVWSYHDRYADTDTESNVADGDYGISLPAVPSGEIWVVNGISLDFWGGNVTMLRIVLLLGAVPVFLAVEDSPVASVPLCWTGSVVLKASDAVRGQFFGCTSTPSLRVSASGYIMKVS